VAWEPGDAQTRYDLAAALKATGDAAGAARELAAARKLDPRLPAVLP
jgi:Flp pilus assembly protein TadD